MYRKMVYYSFMYRNNFVKVYCTYMSRLTLKRGYGVFCTGTTGGGALGGGADGLTCCWAGLG